MYRFPYCYVDKANTSVDVSASRAKLYVRHGGKNNTTVEICGPCDDAESVSSKSKLIYSSMLPVKSLLAANLRFYFTFLHLPYKD